MAIQIAKWKDAKVVVTGSALNKTFCLAFGADQFVDYQTERFEGEFHDVDIVLDLVEQDFTLRSLKTMKPGSHLISFTQPITLMWLKWRVKKT